MVTSLSMSFGALLGGTVIIESIFAMPGLGTLMINAIRSKDIPQVMGSVLFLSTCFVSLC
ncbi:MAG: ABC transporter permease subunit [Faecalimonas umbilicata]